MTAERVPYPTGHAARDRWILERRGPKNRLDPHQPYAFLWEEEPDAAGDAQPTATLFLTNRECPFRCLICDLWQNTLDETVPAGAIVEQIERALAHLPPARQIKLYNSGNFFDPRAIPPEDFPAIAARLRQFERVVVESHPSLVGEACLRFRDMLGGKLEVAMGLETANPKVLARLNKRMTLDGFSRAAAFLKSHQIDLRVFVVLKPPFQDESAGIVWACRSLDFAFEAAADVCSIIPARSGNGAMEMLATTGDFAPPRLKSLEHATQYGLSLGRGRVFADLWDVERFFDCACSSERASRIAAMNAEQTIPPPVRCAVCDEGAE